MTDEQQIQDEVALAIDLEEQGHIKVKKKKYKQNLKTLVF
jgi:hypothetical protein